MTTPKLKSCPFCGGMPFDGIPGVTLIITHDRLCPIYRIFHQYNTVFRVGRWRGWNRRAEKAEAEVERLKRQVDIEQRKVSDLDGLLAKYHEAAEKAEAEVELLRGAVGTWKDEAVELSKRLEKAEAENKALRDEMEVMDKGWDIKQKQLEKAQAELEAARPLLEAAERIDKALAIKTLNRLYHPMFQEKGRPISVPIFDSIMPLLEAIPDRKSREEKK